MACTAQGLITANGCFNNCVTEQQGDWMLTMLLCIRAGGDITPSSDINVIGGEDSGIIGGEGGGMIGAER